MKRSSMRAPYASEAALDIRVGLRRALREPGLTIGIVLTLGLGLGATAAIFTAFRAAVIRPPPFSDPERLVHLWEQRVGTTVRDPTSHPTFEDWRERISSFTGLEGYNPTNVTVGVGDQAQMLRGGRVTVDFFRLLGVPMSSGRDFAPGEDDGPRAGVAIVSQRFAQTAALGETVAVNGTPHVIVGVVPAAFHFAPLQDADVWLPLTADRALRTGRGQRWISVIARLSDDAQLSDARVELTALMAELGNRHPDAIRGRTVFAAPLGDALLGNVKPILTSLLGASVLLFLTLGTNLALLMLTRYVGRGGELGIRSALGATRARILRQLFAEGLALAAFGAVLALVVDAVATALIMAAIPDSLKIGMPYLAGVGLDAGTVAFVSAAAAGLALAFGLGPALLATATGTTSRLGRTRSMTPARGERRLTRGLVVAQLALTVVLLVAGGLLAGSFRNLLGNEVGFADPRELATVRVSLSGVRYQPALAQQQFFEELLERTAGVPGVRYAGAIDRLPLGGGGGTTYGVVDHPTPLALQPRMALRIVGGDYFSTMQIPVLAGRSLEASDRAESRAVAIVSSELARQLATSGVAVGRRIRLAATGDTEWEVVGIVGDVQTAALDAESLPTVYVSHLQAAANRMSVVVRTKLGPGPVANAVRAIVASIDPGVPVYAVGTLAQYMNESRAVFTRRFPMILCIAFAVTALALTLVALYSLSAHDALVRRREFAIRLAMGASRASVRAIVLQNGLLLAVLGVGMGVAAALPASRALSSLLFGISPVDGRVYGAVALGVVAAALATTVLPALRATNVKLSHVMRED